MAADPATPFLGLDKPIVGDEAGEDLWGEKTNANWDKIDANAAGLATAVLEAPQDGQLYGRLNAAWVLVPAGQDVEWLDIVGKPDTFPPDPHSHFQVDIVNLVSDLAAINTAINGKVELNPADGSAYIRFNASWINLPPYPTWSTLTGKPATFPPSAHTHPTSEVTGLDDDLADIATDLATLNTDKIGDAPVDGQQYARKDAAWAQFTIPAPAPAVGLVDIGTTPPGTPLDKQLYWDSATAFLYLRYNDGNSTQWVQVNAQPYSVGEAPLDGQAYTRKDGGWAVGSAGGGGTVPEAPTDGFAYGRMSTGWVRVLPLSGGTITGQLVVNNWFSVTMHGAAGTYAISGTNNSGGGGVIGSNSSLYGILAYAGYSFYGNAGIYCTIGLFASTLTVNGILWAVGSAGSTTTNAVNTYLNPAGNMHRSTSSLEFKQDVEPLWDDYADLVLGIEPIFFRPNDKTVDRTDWSRFGFAAEQCQRVDQRFVACDDESKPIIHDLNAIVASLLSIVRRQQVRIEALEAKL